jgi:hypothetical protein
MNWLKPLIEWAQRYLALAAGAYVKWLHTKKRDAENELEQTKRFQEVRRDAAGLGPSERDKRLLQLAKRKRVRR